jgi:hypothetical protein
MRSDDAEGSDFGALANDSTVGDAGGWIDLAHREVQFLQISRIFRCVTRVTWTVQYRADNRYWNLAELKMFMICSICASAE